MMNWPFLVNLRYRLKVRSLTRQVRKKRIERISPRLRYFPHHVDYMALWDASRPEFRPFVMWVNRANFYSPSVNTNHLGLRRQFDAAGQEWDVVQGKDQGATCRVLVGGSTVFGVDATSDGKTIACHLGGADPWINLGIRGATSQQELALFLAMKRFLPKPTHVVIFSGLNNLALAVNPARILYPEYGAVFDQSLLAPRAGRRAEGNPQSFEEKQEIVLELLRNDLKTWRALSRDFPFRLTYVLQPVLSWTGKSLTAIEAECREYDLASNRILRQLTDPELGKSYRSRVRKICQDLDVEFEDANAWLDDKFEDETLFTDSCHLTDRGNKVMAELLISVIGRGCSITSQESGEIL